MPCRQDSQPGRSGDPRPASIRLKRWLPVLIIVSTVLLTGSCGHTYSVEGPYVDLSVGTDGFCATRDDGSVEYWEGRKKLETGDAIGFGDGTSPATRKATVRGTSCEVGRTGEIACSGSQDHGQADPPPGRFQQIVSAGGSGFCALREDGTVECWGFVLSDGSGYRPFEARVPEGKFSRVAAGIWGVCGLTVEGQVKCRKRDNG